MSGLTTLYGDRWNRDPRTMPLIFSGFSLFLKSSASASNRSDAAGFWTALEKSGAYTAITAADTYVTICNITGRGFLYTIVGTNLASTEVSTLQITIDGAVYTISKTSSGGYRLVFGGIIQGLPLTADGNPIGIGTAGECGISSLVDSIPYISGNHCVTDIINMAANNFPCVKFSTGLKVECKASVLPAAGTSRNCGAMYSLDF